MTAIVAAALMMMQEATVEPIVIKTGRGAELKGVLHRPAKAGGTAVVLAPGQGYHKELPLLKRSAEALAAEGIVAVRFDWAYFTRGEQPSAGLKDEREDFEAALGYARGLEGVRAVVAAGKSLGSIVALERAWGSKDLAGVALLTLPLHEPGDAKQARPGAEKLRTLALPALVISGGSDPLCETKALYAAAAACERAPQVVVVPGDHSLKGASEAEADENVALAARALVAWTKRWAPGR